jgi:hypothetical protein
MAGSGLMVRYRMRVIFQVLMLAVLRAATAISQWSAPQVIDTLTFNNPSIAPLSVGVAIGPRRELAVVAYVGNGVLNGHFSTDNGRSFSRSSVAHSGAYCGATEAIGTVDGVGFDAKSNVLILWRMNAFEKMGSWTSFRISRSVDGGRTFQIPSTRARPSSSSCPEYHW